MINYNYSWFEQIQQSIYTDPVTQNLSTPTDINQAAKTEISVLVGPSYGIISAGDATILNSLTDLITSGYIANPTAQQIDAYLDNLYNQVQIYSTQVTSSFAQNICGFWMNESDPNKRPRTTKKMGKEKDQIMGILGSFLGGLIGGLAGWLIGNSQGHTGDKLEEDAEIGYVVGAIIGWLLLP
ncbi:MAG: hypothetical protein EPN82_06655 [Bacteroidetes bacterium]|nr:MAG: hypothetical protein EPN82_06655 [Bacteroidota bacterium]